MIAGLVTLGWLASKDVGSTVLADAIAQFQHWYGLPITGKEDSATLRRFAERMALRCGVPDVSPARSRVCQWNKPEVTWFVEAVPRLISREQANAVFAEAFRAWAAVCGLKFRQVNAKHEGDIVITTGRGPRAGFDGPSGTLAWSELPCAGTDQQLSQRYDNDENWTVGKAGPAQIALLNVATHEIGHAIGLDHIPPSKGRALMNPVYDRSVPAPLDLDVEEVRRRYGKPTAPPPKPTSPLDPSPVEPGPNPGQRTVIIDITGGRCRFDVRGPILIDGVKV